MIICDVIKNDCEKYLYSTEHKFNLTFFDPPFNQGKKYLEHNDNMGTLEYWGWIQKICQNIYDKTNIGGCIYFMQREKNIKEVMSVLESSGWTFQNLIIWKKKSSAVPGTYRFGKHYQTIVFATKGKKPKTFNRLRIDPPLLVTEKIHRDNGMFVTDVWTDIRELTSGYYAGAEPLRNKDGSRFHNQQSPIRLLLRIILSSTIPGDFVFDPFSGTATTNIVAKQLKRNSISVEKDKTYYQCCIDRLKANRNIDNIFKMKKDYICTEGLENIWGNYVSC